VGLGSGAKHVGLRLGVEGRRIGIDAGLDGIG
jgi:hypothetical protein